MEIEFINALRKIAVPTVGALMISLGSTGFLEAEGLTEDVSLNKGSNPYLKTVTRYLTDPKPKIVGGKPASDGAYPWQVSLGVSWIAKPSDSHFCGGSLINDEWVLTAAHCITDLQPKDIVISAGSINLEDQSSQIRNVEQILYMTEGYDDSTLENDIALIKLFKPFDASAPGVNLSAIPLASSDEDAILQKPETLLTVSGWGTTGEGEASTATLRFVEVPTVSRKDCNASLSYDGKITENMICAGFLSGGKDSCQGDSGGPLTGLIDGESHQIGIVSWGEGCARPRKPGVYTQVSKYHNWIQSCMKNPSLCTK